MNEDYEYHLVGIKKDGKRVYTQTSKDGYYTAVKVVAEDELPEALKEKEL